MVVRFFGGAFFRQVCPAPATWQMILKVDRYPRTLLGGSHHRPEQDKRFVFIRFFSLRIIKIRIIWLTQNPR